MPYQENQFIFGQILCCQTTRLEIIIQRFKSKCKMGFMKETK